MKKKIVSVILCIVFVLSSSSAAMSRTDWGRLFLVDIEGATVVFQVYQDGTSRIWYPYLSDTFDMVLSEQLEWIEDFEYAGIKDWRIAYYWDTTNLKASMFQGMIPGDFNPVPGPFNSSYYFPYTSEDFQPATPPIIPEDRIIYYTHGRTGDEWGDPNTGGSGAIISYGGPPGFNLPLSERYFLEGVPVPGYPLATEERGTFYTLLPTEAQDHWVCMDDGSCMYNDDLNYTPDDLPYVLMGDPAERELGAFTVSEQIPQIWPDGTILHEVKISHVTQPDGILVPVTDVQVFQDERVVNRMNRSSPDARIEYTTEAVVVSIRAERLPTGNGRVYHIMFYFDGGTYTLKIGIPKRINREYLTIDGGPLYDSTRIR
jgi:hypothetical protein